MTKDCGDFDAGAGLKRRIAIQNEKTKLSATAADNVALFACVSVLPAVALSFPLATAPPVGATTVIAIVVWGVLAMSIHWSARTLRNGLR